MSETYPVDIGHGLRLARLAAMAVLMSAASPAHAASFDCEKASAPDERAICGDRALNDLDVQMSDFLEALGSLQIMGANGAMRDDQREWLQKRRTCKSDKSCLATFYKQRVDQLRKSYHETAAAQMNCEGK